MTGYLSESGYFKMDTLTRADCTVVVVECTTLQTQC